MKKLSCPIRPQWTRLFEQHGFSFYDLDGLYWIEGAYYEWSEPEYLALSQASERMHQLCLDLISHVIENKDYRWFGLNPHVIPWIEESWHRKDPSLYGRFDVCFRSPEDIYFYEYNADTPLSILEAGLAQPLWFNEHQSQGFFSSFDAPSVQLQELFKKRIQTLMTLPSRPSSWRWMASSCLEEFENVRCMSRWAREAGADCQLHHPNEFLLHDHPSRISIDGQTLHDEWLFKLYPWEDLMEEQAWPLFLHPLTLEPAWKLLLSNKGLWAALWHYFPSHPFLLETYLESDRPSLSTPYVRKPLFSREGANISIFDANHQLIESQPGPYDGPCIWQSYRPLPQAQDFTHSSHRSHMPHHHDHFSVLTGAWMIDRSFAGLMVREDHTAITKNTALFVPSMVKKSKP